MLPCRERQLRKSYQTLAHFCQEYLRLPPSDRRTLREWLYRLEALGGLGTLLRLGVEVVFNATRIGGDDVRVAITPVELRRAMEAWDHGGEYACLAR